MGPMFEVFEVKYRATYSDVGFGIEKLVTGYPIERPPNVEIHLCQSIIPCVAYLGWVKLTFDAHNGNKRVSRRR